MEKIKVEIWSDIRCPFCYLGKKRFETALDKFQYKSEVEVVWHSFQLDPYLVTQPGVSVYAHLAEVKGISRKQSVEAHEQIVLQGKQFGLEYNFDKAVVANSFHAHRLTHLAKLHNCQNEVEELLFKGYFTDGINISDIDSLTAIGIAAGIPADEVQNAMNSEDFSDNVSMDESYARELGIMGVPFFLFNEKISVRGAQPPETFLQALLKTWEIANAGDSPSENSRSYFLRKF
jgi:predicted DsbA family dithiol-disulfide isomerase